MPQISVILPVCNGVKFLSRAVDSLLAQTCRDWELLIINEYGSDDGSAELAAQYARRDGRIRVLQNRQRLGLAESLNLGFRAAAGDFLARMDADDISYPERFEKQLAFLRAHPEVGICGGWQRHVRGKRCWVHRPPSDPARLAASLLFTCELCHSTVMLRRETVERFHLYYDPRFQAEDYELWTRAISVTKLVNLPEILGDYHVGDTITLRKMGALEKEHGEICAAALERNLGLTVSRGGTALLNAWRNIFRHEQNRKRREQMLSEYRYLLQRVYSANCTTGFLPEQALLDVLRRRWLWAKWDIRNEKATAASIEGVFRPMPLAQCRWIVQKLQKC
ncbi:glycosyltransferase family 2 protein [Oscillibacter sp. GMB15532]|uniref:glycosyltransferase family 2 protein n=1 Tax=Oscillibacter sp. GMB15532 TaxID=3230022 RepID=UPI0034DF78F8